MWVTICIQLKKTINSFFGGWGWVSWIAKKRDGNFGFFFVQFPIHPSIHPSWCMSCIMHHLLLPFLMWVWLPPPGWIRVHHCESEVHGLSGCFVEEKNPHQQWWDGLKRGAKPQTNSKSTWKWNFWKMNSFPFGGKLPGRCELLLVSGSVIFFGSILGIPARWGPLRSL